MFLFDYQYFVTVFDWIPFYMNVGRLFAGRTKRRSCPNLNVKLNPNS